MGEARRKRKNTENTDFMDSQEFADTWDEVAREEAIAKRKRKRREAIDEIHDLMAAQADTSSVQGLNVFPTMEAAWQDFVDHWVHVGLPDKYRDEALRLAFYVGVQSAANLMRYCQGHGEFNLASDQIQEEEVSYYQSEVKPKVDVAKADEWRTGEI
jgi:hypothetical protein